MTEPAAASDQALSTLRFMTRDDLAAVLEIERNSFPAPWPRSAFELAIAAPDLYSVVADGGSLLGYLIACPDVNDLLIANIAVHPAARGHGLGTRLLNAALVRARHLGLTACRLDVRVSNTDAQRLYRHLGFAPVGVRDGYYQQPPEDAITMRRVL